MSYGYSSVYPRVPNSTPQHPSSTRPPIHNPYDKFTQPQFDEWIGGITSTLRKALGQEEEETPTTQATKPREGDTHHVADIDEDNLEDSFAEWKAMRAKEKGKMRATEEEQGSEYGGSQESYGHSDVQDNAAGNTPSDAIELLSDEEDAEGGEVNDLGAYDNGDHGGGLAESFSPAESDGEVQQPYVGSSRPAIPSKSHNFFANTTGQEAIEISDGETEGHDQDDSFGAEDTLFGWGQEEEGEDQQPLDIRDPWEFPKTYAEDLYTGGPIRGESSGLSPSHLTPAAECVTYFDHTGPQLRPSSIVSQHTDQNLAEVSRGSATSALIPSTTDEVSNGDDEVSLYDEDTLELDTPTTAAPRDEPDFISFTALNQPSDVDSERGGPEILYISDNDGGEVSTDHEEAEEDEFDDDGPIPLGTSDLEIPAELELEEEGGEELDELEDDDEPVAEITINPPYGYYGLDASSVTGSGGLDDEARTVGPPSDPPKGDRSEAPDAAISQESTSLLDPHDLVSLPAATTFIENDHQSQSAASIGDTKVSLAEVSFASLGGTPTILDELVGGEEDEESADEDPVRDYTVLADEAVLTVNEVEEVLRDAFEEADQLVSITNDQEGATPISDTTTSIEEQVAKSREPDPRSTTPEVSAGEGPFHHESAIKEDGHNPIELSPRTVKDKPLNLQEEDKKPLPFVMPLVANPNVRDPMSAPWSPVQSGPSTPVAGLAYLPAVTKFKRDNQLLGTPHTSSGLFTPLEGSGSSSPSPSDTATPEDRPGVHAETEAPAVEDDEQHLGDQVTSALASPMTAPPEIPEVDPEVAPTGSPEDDSWGDIPRLPTPPTEVVDHGGEGLPTGPVTRVFFQPEESNDNVGCLDTRSGADHDDDTKGSGTFPALAIDTPRGENGGAPGSNDTKPLVHTTDDTTKDLPEVTETDPFKLIGTNSTVASGAAVSDNDESSIASSSPDEERILRLKVFEIPVPVAEGLQTVESIRPEIQPSSQSQIQAQESIIIPAKARTNLRKRKRSESVPIDPGPSGSVSTVNGEVSNVVTTSLWNGEYGKAGYELTHDEPRNQGGGHDSDNESFAPSPVAPRNADPSSHGGSRASSIVSEQPLLFQGHSPVPEDAPVFHGHGKFKAAMRALKLLRRTSEKNPAQEPEQETKPVKEKEREKEQPVAVEMDSRKTSKNGSNVSTETKRPPSLILPEVSTQTSLPSASTSQSPRTPTSALPPSSPTVVTAPPEVTPPPHQEQTAQEPVGPGREPTQKPAIKVVKRTASRKHIPVEPKSTRSQCRYRKISLPREENGPRVTFCVPQCSLNNKTLMEEEDITDDGLATVRDFERLWDRVEHQKLSPYLISTIRQLVGVDLLRENEIYYLPTDEEIQWMERQKGEERRKSRKSIGGTADAEGLSVTGRSDSISTAGPAFQPSLSQGEKGKLGPPPSFAESISTTASMRSKVGRGGSTRSISGDEVSDGEHGRRASKRRRRMGERNGGGSSRRNTPSIREDSVAPSTAGSPAPSQSTAERTPVRRSRRALKKAVSADVKAYKPSISSGGESSEEEVESVKTRRKSARGGMKGLKRRRTEGTGDSSITSAAGGAGGRDAPLSPTSTRSKRVKIDEK